MLSIMNDLADPDAAGNAFANIVIADAGIDPQKNDPAITSIVIFPDKVVVSSRPLNEQDKQSMGLLETDVPHIQELEQRAVDNGMDIALKHQTSGKTAAILVISDCETVVDSVANANLAIRPHASIPTVRHVSNENNSSDHRALHALADELCRFSRRSKGPTSDMTFHRKALEDIITLSGKNSLP